MRTLLMRMDVCARCLGMRILSPLLVSLFALSCWSAQAADGEKYQDAKPQRYTLKKRASEIDTRVKEYPEISFVFNKDGKAVDVQNASVDTSVKSQGKLVIWLMGHSEPLFERLNSYGLHAIQVHYANGWFGKFGNSAPEGDKEFLGRIRLEAATGEDHSEVVSIAKPDGMMEKAYQFVKWLSKENPQGRWSQFLTEDKKGIRWDRVIISGASHGATTSARFAKHVAVDRVVMLCGPRDQMETWQGLPSKTSANRYFGFTHVLDTGWTGDHYCRAWLLLGLNEFGPVVDVDQVGAPFHHSRRLISAADVGGDVKKAHGCVVPGKSAVKNEKGELIHEAVWKYLYTHPVDQVGAPVPAEKDCTIDLKK